MRNWLRGKITLLIMTCAVLLAVPAIALASDVNVAVVDVTSPTGSVSLSPGGSGNITINMSVTGNQAGTATFEVYRDWTLSGGTFTGSNPQEFTVNPQSGGTTTNFSTTGTVSVAAGEPAGTKTLAVGAFDITNSNTTGAKLNAGTSSNYEVTVLSDPCASVSAPAAPVITANPNTPNGNSGWYKTIPTGVSATSATSGATITYATEVNGGAKSAYSPTAPTLGQGTTVVYAKATSATCNKVSESTRTFMVDSIAPDVNPADVVNNTWRNTDLSQTFTSSDNTNGSGLADPTNDESFTLTASAESVDADTPTVVSRTVSDVAGNSTTRSLSAKIDLTDPSVSLVGGPAAGASYPFGSVPNLPTCTASDLLSGLNGACQVSGYGTAVGSHTVTATANDVAGNSNSDSHSYTVDAWNATGFYAPVGTTNSKFLAAPNTLPTLNSTGEWNQVKGGLTIPLKFNVYESVGGPEKTSTNDIQNLQAQKMDCSATTGGTIGDPVDFTTTEQTSLRYSGTPGVDGQFIQNWKTPKVTATTCYRTAVTLDDGSSIYAFYQLLVK